MEEPQGANSVTTPVDLPDEIAHPFAPQGRVDPFVAYRWLQRYSPVHFDRRSGAWLITGHAACSAVLRDDRFSAARGQRQRARRDDLPVSMLTTDPPEHQRLRAPGSLLLGPAAVRSVFDGISDDLAELLGALAGRVDAVEAIGEPLATAVFARLFGLPAREWGVFAAMAKAASVNLDPFAAPALATTGRTAMSELSRYLDRETSDCPAAQLAADGRITRAERLGILGLAVVGGWQPLAEMVGNALFWLLPRPAALDWMRAADEGRGRLAVDELLRLEAPIPFTARVARTDVPLPGTGPAPGATVPRDAAVLIVISAANRDPAVFDRADELVLDRSPNPHLAYGEGAHYCLGAQLVRSVGALLLPELARRLSPKNAPELVWDARVVPRRLTACPVDLSDPARGTRNGR